MPNPLKTFRLIRQFYKLFALPSILLTVILTGFVFQYGLSVVEVIVPFKLITLALLVFYVELQRRDEFVYYRNLGLDRKQLWGYSISLDLVVFILCILMAKVL
ncbi:MAG: hypothetical protein GC181_06970 [Bacteroidetes bacterium]|nr:hypothetical protein [Bacteroidota bacterium]